MAKGIQVRGVVAVLSLVVGACSGEVLSADGGMDAQLARDAGDGDGGVELDASGADPDAGAPTDDAGVDGGSDAAVTDAAVADAAVTDAALTDAAVPDDASTVADAGFDAGPAPCTSSDQCSATERCDAPTCGGAGSCVPRPAACPPEADPVCGCDGSTYDNECAAHAAGVNVATRGACEMDAGVDAAVPGGCATNADCPGGEYCAKGVNDCAGRGTCAPRPSFCPGVIDPVCGCDGTTYNNDCVAHGAGVNVLHPGACGGSMCSMRPDFGCCFGDDDCSGSTRCVGATCRSGGEGTCVSAALASGECWEDGDCRSGETCTGERICPCGAFCILPDEPGTCTVTF